MVALQLVAVVVVVEEVGGRPLAQWSRGGYWVPAPSVRPQGAKSHAADQTSCGAPPRQIVQALSMSSRLLKRGWNTLIREARASMR